MAPFEIGKIRRRHEVVGLIPGADLAGLMFEPGSRDQIIGVFEIARAGGLRTPACYAVDSRARVLTAASRPRSA